MGFLLHKMYVNTIGNNNGIGLPDKVPTILLVSGVACAM